VRALRNPKVVVSTALGVALLATLVGVSDVGKVANAVRRLNLLCALAFVVLMITYETIRGLQWHVLLDGLGVRVPLRAEVFSYLWGEATKAAPAGSYFQNYLLGRTEGEDFGRTAAATTLVVLTEIGLGLLLLCLVPIEGWPWLRPATVTGLAALLILAGIGSKVMHNSGPPNWMTRYRGISFILDTFRRLREGIATLSRPQLFGPQAALCALYIFSAGAGLFVLAIGLGVNELSLRQSLGIYAFTMTVGLRDCRVGHVVLP
jgi:lysylphosphatidylglycerol synthase-like protein